MAVIIRVTDVTISPNPVDAAQGLIIRAGVVSDSGSTPTTWDGWASYTWEDMSAYTWDEAGGN